MTIVFGHHCLTDFDDDVTALSTVLTLNYDANDNDHQISVIKLMRRKTNKMIRNFIKFQIMIKVKHNEKLIVENFR